MAASDSDVIVIGAAMAALTAANTASAKRAETTSIEALMFGGLVVNINALDSDSRPGCTRFASNLMMEISEPRSENLSATVTGIGRNGNGLSVTTRRRNT